MRNYKNKNLAALLAFFGGIIGLHRFYLGQNGRGFLMILLSIFTFGALSSIIGIMDCVAFLLMSEERFDFKYNNPDEIVRRSPRYRSYDRQYQTGEFSGNGQSLYRKDRRINKTDYQQKVRQKKIEGNRSRTSRPKQSSASRSQRKTKEKLINNLKESGIEKFKEYDIEGSVVDFQKILELDPHHIAAHFNLACAYSQLEKPRKSMYHISRAVRAGFDDFERLKKHEKLAFARIQPEWEEFVKNGFIFVEEDKVTQSEGKTEKVIEDTPSDDHPDEKIQNSNEPSGDLLVHLKNLKEQREKGIITEVEFEIERRKLMSS